MKNVEIAEIFYSISKMLELKGENIFRIRAYDKAAQIVSETSDIEDYAKLDKLTDIPGIGKDLAEKIKEYLSTGKIEYFEELQKDIPKGILELLKVPSIGPKTAKLFFDKLKIKDIDTLEEYAKCGKLLELEGIKKKTVENILHGINLVRKGKERIDIASGWDIADAFVFELKKVKDVDKIAVAGSLRRMKETIKDVDILLTSKNPEKVLDVFCKLKYVKEIIAQGPTKSSVLSYNGIQVDVRVVEPNAFGAALQYFTGSKNHNVKLRTLAVRKGYKINEYGVYKGKKCVPSKAEEDIYKVFRMPYIEPELREDTGEIEAALKNELPEVITLKDIKGDFHAHSIFSDGHNTIEEMADECIKLGYEYVLLTDHSESLKVANGLSVAELSRKKKEIERLNSKFKDFRILYGTEAEIDSKGEIDYNDRVLEEFDFVVGAVHSGLKQSKEQLTKRIVNACKNPHVDIIAHPTGRHWGIRDSYELDFDEVFKVARETNTFFEINSFPIRLDLGDSLVRLAKSKGVRFTIGSDSHKVEHLRFLKYGVGIARRGWLEKEDVLNTFSLKEVMKRKK